MSERRTPHRKLRALGEAFAGIPEARGIRDEAAALLADGSSDDEVRAVIVERWRELGMPGPKSFLTGLSRKVWRMDLRDLLHQVADDLADWAKGKRLEDVLDDLWRKLDAERSITDYMLAWAKDPDGEPGPFLPQMAGRVWTQKVGPSDAQMDTVWVCITPLSDPKELLKEAYEECHRVLPDGTWSRYSTNMEAHRILRMRLEHPEWSLGDVAEALLRERSPELWGYGHAVVADRVRKETERVQKLMERFWKDYADSFFEELSPGSD